MTVTIPKDVLTDLARAAPIAALRHAAHLPPELLAECAREEPWAALRYAAALLPPELIAEFRARYTGSTPGRGRKGNNMKKTKLPKIQTHVDSRCCLCEYSATRARTVKTDWIGSTKTEHFLTCVKRDHEEVKPDNTCAMWEKGGREVVFLYTPDDGSDDEWTHLPVECDGDTEYWCRALDAEKLGIELKKRTVDRVDFDNHFSGAFSIRFTNGDHIRMVLEIDEQPTANSRGCLGWDVTLTTFRKPKDDDYPSDNRRKQNAP